MDHYNIKMANITLSKDYQDYLRTKYEYQFLPHEVEEIYEDNDFGSVSTKIELILL